jgi:ABC-type cobalamin/Fe3+-siderophores transport system ATPase subunit
MKLISLYIDEYKNIEKQNFDFSNNTGYIALIGENGSGKSNLLETISIIFSYLYNGQNAPFNYKIVYDLAGQSQTVESKDGKIISDKAQYPSSVIACYSGEDLRLWHMAYEGYHMQYFNKAISNKLYIPSLLYINKYCWKIAFISLLCASEQGDHSITDFLMTKLGINEASEVELIFTIDHEKLEKFKNHDALSWFNRFSETNYNVNAKVLATTEPNPSNDEIRKQKICKTIFQYLYLLSQPKQNEINKVDKLITDITIKIKDIDFDNLSEGEKKLILIECITKVLGDEGSLILLDEPDAHIHIARKKELLNAIDSFEGQAVLTTHSPVFVNEINKKHASNLYFIEKGEITSSTFVNKLTELSGGEIDYLNGTIVLSSKQILVTEGPYDKRYIEKAIEIWSAKEEKYKKLSQVAIIPSNSASNADTFYNQVIFPQINRYQKIVFLFDFDDGGYSGWKKISNIKEEKLEALFYQHDYSISLNTNNSPKTNDTIMVEDFFDPEAYKVKVDWANLNNKKSHKDFRSFRENMASIIKSYIEKNYNSFKDEWFDGFKPVLDQLISIFQL